jgi:nitrogenase-associated protein
MTDIVFYAKPGCLTNRRQQALLVRHGHRVTVRDLLSEPWSPERLYEFLKSRPVSEWFNPAAPAIKLGAVDPEGLDEAAALRLLVADPVLILRPLLETNHGRYAGFDTPEMQALLGISAQYGQDHASCSQPGGQSVCNGGG